MDNLQLLIDLHKDNDRQGPGGEAQTQQAIALAGLDPKQPLKIADIGCGTGSAALQLAQSLNAHITAVDFLPEFIEKLQQRAVQAGVRETIETLVCGMEQLPFDPEIYDVFWSEGAIYNMGFRAGINTWRKFLKPGGILVVSEITWTTANRPAEIQHYWETEYPEIETAAGKLNILEQADYAPLGYFVLPKYCWRENYYQPLQNRFQDFLSRHDHSPEAQAIITAEEKEIALYEKYADYYSYGVYIAQKLA